MFKTESEALKLDTEITESKVAKVISLSNKKAS
jgi:hypothetical protein